MSKDYIVANVRELCAKKGITIQKLEQETGIGNGVVARWAKSYPRVDTLQKVAEYFGVKLNRLVRPVEQ